MVEDLQQFTATLFTCQVEMYVHAAFCDAQCNSRWCVAGNAVNICTLVIFIGPCIIAIIEE